MGLRGVHPEPVVLAVRVLAEYANGGTYDIAVSEGRFTPSKAHHGTADHVAALASPHCRRPCSLGLGEGMTALEHGYSGAAPFRSVRVVACVDCCCNC